VDPLPELAARVTARSFIGTTTLVAAKSDVRAPRAQVRLASGRRRDAADRCRDGSMIRVSNHEDRRAQGEVKMQDHIRRVVDDAPPLAPEQRERLARLLASTPGGRD